jgi:hypothetical protein
MVLATDPDRAENLLSSVYANSIRTHKYVYYFHSLKKLNDFMQ